MTDRPPVALALARRLARVTLAGASDDAIGMARDAVIDTVGVTLAGAREPAVDILRLTLQDSMAAGPALVFGDDGRVNVLDAAMINGTAAHAIDYDDMASAMGGHPSVPVVPVVFALGEMLGAPGSRVLEAYIVGFEAECRLGRMVLPHHYEHGWHPTATLGVFGAAAAASRLLGLDEAHGALALALAASLASGVKANFGTMTKPLHVGHCARNGLLAALLAQNGFTARLTTFEDKEGFFAAFDGLENVHLDEVLRDDDTLEVGKTAFGFKQFPCCGSTHPAILAMLDLVRTQRLGAEDVAAIEVATHRRRLPHTNNPDPQTSLAAKFSIQYVTARALVDGAVRLGHFEADAHREPVIQDLLARTTTRAFAEGGSGDEFAAEVTVTTRSGDVLKGRAASALGRGLSNPMSADEKWEKFSDCACRVLPQAQARQAFDALGSIERLDSILDVTRLLERSGTPLRPAAGLCG